MPFPATAVANELLDRASAEGLSLTQINIQKLVYFAHGWNLGWSANPLILDPIEAWQYGPVVRNLYNQFRRFGSSPITGKAVEFRIDSNGKIGTTCPTLEDAYSKSVVGAVWNQYGRLQPFKLVELTHAPGSPWEAAWNAKKALIENEDIRRYFSALAQPRV
ncbi:Panacea domain-containing protein [Granulicella tundricola]|uniref:Phage-associated protein-like protein n=1 Tax=Granulicella tundricola (strain ATCC BAA-1859 / DSM 23138 / MP5ACTX9) TaxID=1198114 RepID=E8X4Z5_GRATM|nr:type II toxin-antitoxin system antitoxin SocA domain-containing protein [Granulicella tundricola]ADW67187.1 phage-associated protein-like protein [Granulicella tundricola MP5ACTX9]